MLNEISQKDWTLKLFIHNFLKEKGLKNTMASFENEVMQSTKYNQDLPIKSNKTFLLEWWNIFFSLYSEMIIKEFKDNNHLNTPIDLLNSVSMSELFKPGVLNFPFETYVELNNLVSNSIKKYSQLGCHINTNFPLQGSCLPNAFDLGASKLPMGNLASLASQAFHKEGEPIQKMNSEGSFSMSYDTNSLKKIKDFHKENRIRLFHTNTAPHLPNNSSEQGNDMLKKRKRYIKNNKFVFVHPGSAAAKKLEMQKIQAENEEDSKEEVPDENGEGNIASQDVNNSISMSDPSHQGKKPRGSRYRGVSRNGNQWQVLIMVNKKKRYVGSYSNEEEAARAYDKVALQNHGTKAKTNFDYLDEDVKKILVEPPLLKIT